MKTTKKHFELFKKECQYWIDRFELNNYSFYYLHKDLGERYAESRINAVGHTATLFLGEDFGEMTPTTDLIKSCAKHEVLHVLIGKMTEFSKDRYVMFDMLEEAWEELVRKLEIIIK